ncbi:peptide-methionine (S)-S-oxide reductase [Winogradskyella sp. A3E31]|uniref:peptide-methionine (S)-S-oxide reductase n=1 Tax=Winogradskyella sp. A3E31 TaxID=3349637 RepID=UPI00398A601F
MTALQKIALGGGCHWCTEAVFQSLKGVENVEQGYVASVDGNSMFSEAVIVHFNPQIISLNVLIEIHLHTHKSTVNHSMRQKYRSAIYTFSEIQKIESETILKNLQSKFDSELVTVVLPFSEFKASRKQIQNYYYDNPEKPFCERFINPKLIVLLQQFSEHTNQNKLKHLQYVDY